MQLVSSGSERDEVGRRSCGGLDDIVAVGSTRDVSSTGTRCLIILIGDRNPRDLSHTRHGFLRLLLEGQLPAAIESRHPIPLFQFSELALEVTDNQRYR